MTHRTFDEQIANFNRVVSSWDINQEYKVALLGMIASLGYEHEKSITPEPHWIPVTEATPTEDDDYWCTFGAETGWFVDWCSWYQGRWVVWTDNTVSEVRNVIAWCKPLEPYKGVADGND